MLTSCEHNYWHTGWATLNRPHAHARISANTNVFFPFFSDFKDPFVRNVFPRDLMNILTGDNGVDWWAKSVLCGIFSQNEVFQNNVHQLFQPYLLSVHLTECSGLSSTKSGGCVPQYTLLRELTCPFNRKWASSENQKESKKLWSCLRICWNHLHIATRKTWSLSVSTCPFCMW